MDPYGAYTEQAADYDYDTPDLGWVLPPFPAGLLAVAGRLLAVLAYRDAFALGDNALNRRSAKATATLFAQLPAECDRQDLTSRLAWARCLDDLAADLEAGRAPLPRWSVGCVTLLGDACHPMLPFMAQPVAKHTSVEWPESVSASATAV